jgi:hypothetical protein
MIIYYERYVVIQPGIAKNADGEAFQRLISYRRRIFKYFRYTSSRKSIFR